MVVALLIISAGSRDPAGAVIQMTGALVLVLPGLAAIAGLWFLREQVDVLSAQVQADTEARSLETFLRFRDKALSPDHTARRGRVVAVLDLLRARGMDASYLEQSRDFDLYLNDYEWVGRLVKEGRIETALAMSTFGRSVQLLYPLMGGYVEHQRSRRRYEGLWANAEWFHDCAERLRPLGFDDDERFRQLHLWLDPETRLTDGSVLVLMGPEVGVQTRLGRRIRTLLGPVWG